MLNCKHKGKGLTNVFRIGSCDVWAGGEAQAKPELPRMRVAVSLLGDLRSARGFTLNEEAERGLPALSKLSRGPSIVNVPWPDGGVPGLGLDFWRALEQDLAFTKGDAVLFCLAGHGRTGTALTILATLAGLTKGHDPVLWVREQYCKEVVETWRQIDYLDELGIPTMAKPSHILRTGGHKGYTGAYWGSKRATEAPGGLEPDEDDLEDDDLTEAERRLLEGGVTD